jgi:hypothetical protein
VVFEICSTPNLLLLVYFGQKLFMPFIDRRKAKREDMKVVIMAVLA